jgi:chaperone modulatory protein CbpM
MIREQDLVEKIDRLQADALTKWIESGWVVPRAGDDGAMFHEAEVARVRLICDLVYDFEVGEESLPVILSLLDQLHDSRRMLRAVAVAIGEQPEDVQRQLAVLTRNALGRDE